MNPIYDDMENKYAMNLPDLPIVEDEAVAPTPTPEAQPTAPPSFDPKALEQEALAHRRKQALMSGVGGAIDSLLNIPDAASIRLGIQKPKQDVQSTFNQIAATQQDPWSKQKQIYENYKASKEAQTLKLAEEKRAREDKEDSPESKMADGLARSMGYNGPALSATQFKAFGPMMEKQYEMGQRLLDRKDARDERRFLAGMSFNDKKEVRAQKEQEKLEGLKTPFGIANDADDAKKLKEAWESKANFDNKIQEMIDLRIKHVGGTIWNRDDVARSRQLSKDTLLEYKNMAKLGVLSKSDEDIINKIIPEDPLQYASPLATIRGEDPTLHVLQKFKSDSDKDFKNRVMTRVRNDGNRVVPKPERTVVKTQTNKRTGERRILYSDGTTETLGSVAGQ